MLYEAKPFTDHNHGDQKLGEFLSYLHNKEPTIKCIIEREQNHQIPFSNIPVKKKLDTFKTFGYRKYLLIPVFLICNSNPL